MTIKTVTVRNPSRHTNDSKSFRGQSCIRHY